MINYYKMFLVSLFIGLIATGLGADYSTAVTNRIASQVLRLHIVPNSDSEEDQSLKLAVRGEVLSYLQGFEVDSRFESEAMIEYEILNIIEVAKQGHDYPVTASIENSYFPTKAYDGFSLPAGQYDALTIKIGEGNGQNWWCVVYPDICGGTNDLEQALRKDDYEMVTNPVFKFRVIEWFNAR